MLSILLTACSGPESPRTYGPCRPTSRPYVIKGQSYTPQLHYELEEQGLASHYGIGDRCHGSFTSTGEYFDTFELTAAHKTLPLPCIVRVINLENGRSVILKVNDRGPFIDRRIIDVSARAAQLLGFYHKGLASVRVTTLIPESLALAENQPGYRRPRLNSSAFVTVINQSARDSYYQNPQPTHGIPTSQRPSCLSSKRSLPPSSSQSPSSFSSSHPSIRRSLPFKKVYLLVKAASLAHALAIEDHFKGYGPTDLRHQSSQSFCVIVGPFHSIKTAKHVQKKMAMFYNSVMIHQ